MRKITTAKVQHRDYVPWGWLAIEFCDVDFYGFRAEEMERKWTAIEHKRYEQFNSIYEENEKKSKSMRDKANAIYKQVAESKPFYRFWYNKAEKEMIHEADNLINQAYQLEQENKDVEDKRFFNNYEARSKIEELLQQNGFSLTHTSSSGDECVTETEVWTLEEQE